MKHLLLSTLILVSFLCVHAQIITTIAGTGVTGYDGDNNSAVAGLTF